MGPDYWLFLYFLATIPAFLGLALVAQLGRSARARRGAEVMVLTGAGALLVVVARRAVERPLLWLAVALLLAVLLFGLVMHVRSYRRPL